MTGDQQPANPTANLTQRLDVDFALQAAGLGVWEYNPTTGEANWDERCRALYGLTKGNQITYEQAFKFIHPDDRELVKQTVAQVLTPPSDGHYDLTFRTVGGDDGLLRWVRFMGKAEFTPTGEVTRFGGVAQEVTQQVLSNANQQQLFALFEQSPVAIALISNEELTFQTANPFYGTLVGRRPQEIIGKPLLEALPELQGQGFDELLKEVIATGRPYIATEVQVELIRDGQLETIYVDLTYQPRREANGDVSGILVVATDVTQQVQARKKLEESEARFRALLQEAPVATMVMVGAQHTIELANEKMIQMLGKGPSIQGQPARAAVPELAGQTYMQLLDSVYLTGIAHEAQATPGELWINGAAELHYFDFAYKPLRDPDGAIYGILSMAVDVTQQVLTRRHLEETLGQMRALIESAPFPIGVYIGPDMQIRFANQAIIDVYGKGPDVIGKSYLELLPELANQHIFEQLRGVYETGIPFASGTQRVNIEHQGRLVPYYFNYNFTPLHDAQGQVYGVMNTAANVTPLELARQQVEETATALQNAIELAQLGTFSVDVTTNRLTCSPRVADWFGFDSLTADAETFINGVGEGEREYVRTSLSNTLLPGSDGRYDVIHSVIHAKTGHQIIIHALGRVYFDKLGQPLKVEGTAQDITAQRELQLVLETQVQQRTQALQLANQDLKRSNDNLQQFAYIASHDLQEPLRKIQSFSTLLGQQVDGQLGQQGHEYLQRITNAGARMSSLIKDLLTYSRISTRQQEFGLVSLESILAQVLLTFDWSIAERSAQIELDELPVVRGDETQLSQLFQNLFSNALKFTPADQAPQIQIQCFVRERSELPLQVRPTSDSARFIQISVRDQGVGFDPKYVDRIFQVFQRLHGKNEFPGTGVGLAICQKVVENHGGAITADSKPGEGSTFCVYLPA